jgi:hypothetical protein
MLLLCFKWDLTCEENLWKLTIVGTVNNIGQFVGLSVVGLVSDRWVNSMSVCYALNKNVSVQLDQPFPSINERLILSIALLTPLRIGLCSYYALSSLWENQLIRLTYSYTFRYKNSFVFEFTRTNLSRARVYWPFNWQDELWLVWTFNLVNKDKVATGLVGQLTVRCHSKTERCW